MFVYSNNILAIMYSNKNKSGCTASIYMILFTRPFPVLGKPNLDFEPEPGHAPLVGIDLVHALDLAALVAEQETLVPRRFLFLAHTLCHEPCERPWR